MAALTGALQDRGDVFRKGDPRLRVALRGRKAGKSEYTCTDEACHGQPDHPPPGTPHHDSLPQILRHRRQSKTPVPPRSSHLRPAKSIPTAGQLTFQAINPISWTVSTEGGTTSGLRPRLSGRSTGVPTAPARWGGVGTARFTFGRYTPLKAQSPAKLDQASFQDGADARGLLPARPVGADDGDD